MKAPWLIWIPRVLIMAFALFTIVFSFDAIEMPGSIWRRILGLLIHNIPFIVISIILWATWFRPLMGGILFILISILFTLFFQTYHNWSTLSFITGPPLVVGVLFLIVHWKQEGNIRHY